MKNALFGLLFASTILAGCASQMMGEMVGKDVNQIVAQYGPPVNSFDLPDGRRAFQWRLDSAYVMPTTTTFTGYGNVATAFNSGGAIISNACYYTLYTKPNPQKSYTVVSFEPPRMDCE